MGRITLQQAAQWCGGKIDPKYKDVVFFGAGNDTRKLEPGQLFVALQGVRDGHEFVGAALEKGAAAVLCTHCDGDYPAIVVPDTRIALGEIAAQERLRIGMKVVGVTGSVGKSTTKEMIAAVLGSQWRVSKTPVNHNNDIGMPMAILSMPEDTQIAVLEMGMNHFREIGYLTGIAKPDLAVIINIGTMHIEHLGSMEGILRAKLEIIEGMPEDGKLILNGDDTLLWSVRDKLRLQPLYFGSSNDACAVRGLEIREEEAHICFRVESGEGSFDIELPVVGLHHVSDALAAVAVGLECGVTPDNISRSLGGFRNMAGRQEIFRAGEFTVIKDCYNAGPESMAAALSVLGKKPGRHIAVLGDMLELGVRAAAEHYKVGRIAAMNADMVFAYGPNSSKILHGAITGGMTAMKARAFEDQKTMAEVLKQVAKPGDVLLFKGSNGMHMERVLEMFLQEDK